MGDEMSHVVELAERIGARPTTTDSEAEASDYIQGLFEARGLEVERQEFDAPRTYGWAYVAYHALTIGAAVLALWYPWPAFAIALAVAVVLWLDLDTRGGLTSVMPKGPTQNVIARHVPRTGRNERSRRVVVVAHYDSAKSSLAFSPGLVRNFWGTFTLMKLCTMWVPFFILVVALPWTQGWRPWTGYVALASAIYLLVPLFINIHRELFGKLVAGANDNASGVAAMLGVMERICPEAEQTSYTGSLPRVRRTEEDAWAADVLPEDTVLTYAPAEAQRGSAPAAEWSGPVSWTDSDDDLGWDETTGAGQQALGFSEPTPEQSAELFGTGPIEPVTPAPAPAPAPAPVAPAPAPPVPAPVQMRPAPPSAGESWLDETAPMEPLPAPQAPTGPSREDLFGVGPAPDAYDDEDEVEPLPGPAPTMEPIPEKRGLFGRGKRRGGESGGGVRGWLGVDKDFDARKEGKDLGTWDSLHEDEDDESGFKGGSAEPASIDDPDFAASVAARIRRKVTSNEDRELVEKEVWFVATGAEESGTYGMRALMRKFGDDLRDSFIVNIDNVGSGSVVYVTKEGMARRYESDRRMVGAAKRVVREAQLDVRPQEYKGLSTDATPALARGYRAMSVMAFDINGRLPNWHWPTDTVENVSEDTITRAVDFVAELIKEL
jgi:hypothetical protein